MEKVKAYDLPTRAFHWIFAILFITAYSIGNFVDDESALYVYHMISGMVMAFMVVLRIIWGFVGTKYARFSSFMLKPSELIGYFKSIFAGKNPRELGHNPASSYAAIGMFVFSFTLVATGLLMLNNVYNAKHTFKEIHEVFATLFLVTVIIHIVGVIYHQLRNHDGMPFSMLTGKKDPVDGQIPIDSNAVAAFVVYLVLTFSFAGSLLGNYDKQEGELHAFGKSLHLKHEDHHDRGGHEGKVDEDKEHHEREAHFDDDDDDAAPME